MPYFIIRAARWFASIARYRPQLEMLTSSIGGDGAVGPPARPSHLSCCNGITFDGVTLARFVATKGCLTERDNTPHETEGQSGLQRRLV